MGRAVAPCHHLRVDSGQKQQGRQQASLLVVLRVGVMPMPILMQALAMVQGQAVTRILIKLQGLPDCLGWNSEE